MIRILTAFVLLVSMAFSSNGIRAEGGEQHAKTLKLPTDLMALLQAEMREITAGMQLVPLAIAQGDWETLHKTGESIRTSYIMAKSLSTEQKEFLKSSLPAGFKQLDSEFHKRAGSLARAAEARDFELASYHYSRMVEGCAQCHSLYAKERFPGFGSEKEHGHQH